ncbi:MAG: LuxR C-terminal-related transcriptional regulator [Actinomycetota bacterium]|nr:LuxR C-terminal-related transcriptional regulator [Actinomycetota bacterium]
MASRISSKDYRAILDIIDMAYSSFDRTATLLAIFEKLEKWIGISSGVFLPLDIKTGIFKKNGAVSFNIEDGPLLSFFSYYAPLHPLVQKKMHMMPLNKSLRLTDFIPASSLHDTAWGRDFQPKVPIFYELSANLGSRGAPSAGFALHRKKSDKDFTAQDIAVMDILLPHLSRAMDHTALLEQMALQRDDIRTKLSGFNLTRREHEITALAVRGLSNRQIAERLFITEMTVKDHLKNIFGKLDVKRRSELAAKILGFCLPDKTNPE